MQCHINEMHANVSVFFSGKKDNEKNNLKMKRIWIPCKKVSGYSLENWASS